MSVLGYTKRIAERLTAWYSGGRPTGPTSLCGSGTCWAAGARCWPPFRAQVASGGPVTVTDPDVTRYFMTVEEAVQLVIQAGAIGETATPWCSTWASPCASPTSPTADPGPGKRVGIVFTGLRPGEKLHEVLLGINEVDDRPSHELVSQVPVSPLDPSSLNRIHAQGDIIAPMIELCANRADVGRRRVTCRPMPSSTSPISRCVFAWPNPSSATRSCQP